MRNNLFRSLSEWFIYVVGIIEFVNKKLYAIVFLYTFSLKNCCLIKCE